MYPTSDYRAPKDATQRAITRNACVACLVALGFAAAFALSPTLPVDDDGAALAPVAAAWVNHS